MSCNNSVVLRSSYNYRVLETKFLFKCTFERNIFGREMRWLLFRILIVFPNDVHNDRGGPCPETRGNNVLRRLNLCRYVHSTQTFLGGNVSAPFDANLMRNGSVSDSISESYVYESHWGQHSQRLDLIVLVSKSEKIRLEEEKDCRLPI